MNGNEKNQGELTHKDQARLLMNFIHRLIMHHGMWFAEIQKQCGTDTAFDALETVSKKSFDLQLHRIAKTLGFDMKDSIPAPLLDLDESTLVVLKEKIAANWLANDGIWFQAIEFSKNMTIAKKCNDACWRCFSPLEAWSVKQFLDLPSNSGVEGLKKALEFRIYAAINKQSVEQESSNSIILRMLDCRVQSTRKRKGLDDYPCHSAGIVEFTTFAESIDSRFKTECIGCPPGDHPEEWFCAWRFSLQD